MKFYSSRNSKKSLGALLKSVGRLNFEAGHQNWKTTFQNVRSLTLRGQYMSAKQSGHS